MLHRKDKNFPLSVPVSRVGSSTRLSLMGTASNPSTPSAYVVSSLNPTKNLPFTSSSFNSRITTKDELDRFEQLPMVQGVNALEETLASLTSRISLFKDDGLKEDVDRFVAYSNELLVELEKLEQHAQLGRDIGELRAQNDTLDDLGKLVLKELLACREALKRLPRLPASKRTVNLADQLNSLVDVKEVLKYAMKLAKFTRAPATMANALFQIHPNNYIWPAEDALRKGMLAMSSIHSDELIKMEIGEDTSMEEAEEEKAKPESEEKATEEAKEKSDVGLLQRKNSFGNYGATISMEGKPDGGNGVNALDLDLFDPDEDDYSD